MRKAIWGLALACALAAFLASVGTATAATAGNECGADSTGAEKSVVSLRNPVGYPLASAIPTAGVITGWTYNVGRPIPNGVVQPQLKVFTSPGPGQFTVVAESPFEAAVTGVNSYAARIPVKGGELIGSSIFAVGAPKVEQGYFVCETSAAGDEVAFVPGDPSLGSTVPELETKAGLQNPVTVTVEPDADGDGYGDLTQDGCPTDAGSQAPCPSPSPPSSPPPAQAATKTAPPISLNAIGTPGKRKVTVVVTASGQASVTVSGSAKLAKGKPAKLSGGTKETQPGSLTTFSVPFPARLRKALEGLPPAKKVNLTLIAEAPGATSKTVTVKVPGEESRRTGHRSRP